MEPDRAYKHNSQQVIVNQPGSVHRKRDQIVEIIRANPGISAKRIGEQYYGEKYSSDAHRRMSSMLLSICCDGRIKCVDNRYSVKEVDA